MLVYEKGTGTDRHLYGTMGTAPSEDDSQLTYVDDDEQEVEVSFTDVLFNDGHGGMLNEDGDHVNVKIDDTYIIPAGYVPPTPETITFNIGNGAYQAEADMTFGDWIDSDYNTDGFKASEGNGVVNADESKYVALENTAVTTTDKIVAETSYSLEPIPVSTFEFTIAGATQEAEEGMTWKDWVDSGYNTTGFTVQGALVCLGPNQVQDSSGENVMAPTLINKLEVYSLSTQVVG